MAKKLAAEVVETLEGQISAAGAALAVAHEQVDAIAAQEDENLQSDEVYSAWQRRARIAQLEVDRLAVLVAKLEVERAAKIARDEQDRFTARWRAAAERNCEVADRMQAELSKAWVIIKAVLEAAALAEIETEAVLRNRPPGFVEPTSIVDTETFRRRPSFDEEILEVQTVDLFVCKRTGNLFADQSKQKPHSLIKKFKQVTYLPAQRGDAAKPFWSELIFPRLDDGGPALFDGSELVTPHDVLRALRAGRPERRRQQQVRIEPIAQPSVAGFDGGPAIDTRG